MTQENKSRRTLRLGELLLVNHFVTPEQLENARRQQGFEGHKLGSTLVELGYLSVDDLVKALVMQCGVEGLDLERIDLQPALLALLPLETMKKHQVIPVAAKDRKIAMAMVNPGDIQTLGELQFILGQSIRPLVVPAFQMIAALGLIESRSGQVISGADIARACVSKPKETVLPDVRDLFGKLVVNRASDLLLVAGAVPSLKLNNELVRLPLPVLTPQTVHDYARGMMTDFQWDQFLQTQEADFAYSLPEWGRFRVSAYRQRKSISLAIRHIVEEIPSLAGLGLPPSFENFALKTQGLILITGPTGHGKTTTLAALIDIINTRQKKNIITIEDPIEYLHTHKSSNVNQREVGVDIESFHAGLRRIFREAPDVIVIGEMRDLESFSIALQAADSGHLVISCMHANNAVMAVNHIIDIFPPEQQHQVRAQLADNFVCILNQRLVVSKDGKGRVLAFEKLENTPRTRNLIRDRKENQIRRLMQQNMDEFWSLDVSLAQLVREHKVTLESPMQYCQEPLFFNELVQRGGGCPDRRGPVRGGKDRTPRQ
ncbi:PilT/PilU family type 4a pilus ATPase [Trichloromonas sp.]|uniref:PilT/PilU family type 4a pilus ATPase n=1 Tax=Trichloromonas sp. TaxID=3069249 RepID=UPI002A4449B4|nr:PilT/PilU family type 4a pilus ATPase [Trichloromonas sp.]